jgi:hypothetical protein
MFKYLKFFFFSLGINSLAGDDFINYPIFIYSLNSSQDWLAQSTFILESNNLYSSYIVESRECVDIKTWKSKTPRMKQVNERDLKFYVFFSEIVKQNHPVMTLVFAYTVFLESSFYSLEDFKEHIMFLRKFFNYEVFPELDFSLPLNHNLDLIFKRFRYIAESGDVCVILIFFSCLQCFLQESLKPEIKDDLKKKANNIREIKDKLEFNYKIQNNSLNVICLWPGFSWLTKIESSFLFFGTQFGFDFRSFTPFFNIAFGCFYDFFNQKMRQYNFFMNEYRSLRKHRFVVIDNDESLYFTPAPLSLNPYRAARKIYESDQSAFILEVDSVSKKEEFFMPRFISADVLSLIRKFKANLFQNSGIIKLIDAYKEFFDEKGKFLKSFKSPAQLYDVISRSLVDNSKSGGGSQRKFTLTLNGTNYSLNFHQTHASSSKLGGESSEFMGLTQFLGYVLSDLEKV